MFIHICVTIHLWHKLWIHWIILHLHWLHVIRLNTKLLIWSKLISTSILRLHTKLLLRLHTKLLLWLHTWHSRIDHTWIDHAWIHTSVHIAHAWLHTRFESYEHLHWYDLLDVVECDQHRLRLLTPVAVDGYHAIFMDDLRWDHFLLRLGVEPDGGLQLILFKCDLDWKGDVRGVCLEYDVDFVVFSGVDFEVESFFFSE